MAISNISLAYPNYIDSCTFARETAGDFIASLPLANIQNHVLKKVARTKNGVTSTEVTPKAGQISVTFGIVLPKARQIGCVAIARHNLTTNAKVRIRGFYNADFTNTALQIAAGATNQFDSGVDYFAYPRIFAPESGAYLFNDPNWWYGTIESEQLHSYTPLVTFYPNENKVCQSLVITIVDNGNADNFIEFGRVFLGRCVEPKHNPEYGDLSQGYVDLTEVQRAGDNTKYFYVKPKMRTVSGVLKHLSKEEAFSGFYDAQREVGLSGELLYAFSKPEYSGNINMTTDKNFYARTFLCNFSELSPIDMPYVNGYATALKLEEII